MKNPIYLGGEEPEIQSRRALSVPAKLTVEQARSLMPWSTMTDAELGREIERVWQFSSALAALVSQTDPEHISYNRVSSERQGNENCSLDQQEADAKAFAASPGWTVLDYVKDETSSWSASRPLLEDIVSRCEKDRSITKILVHRYDRAFRSVYEFLGYEHRLKATRSQFFSITEPSCNGWSPDAFTARLNKIMQAQQDNQDRSIKSTKGMKNRVQNGYHAAGAPLGYTNERELGGRLDYRGRKADLKVIRPDNRVVNKELGLSVADLIRMGFELFATGQYSRNEVLRQLTLLGLRNAKGKPIDDSTFEKTLRICTYAGYVSAAKAKQAKHRKEQLFEVPDWEVNWVKGEHYKYALVSEDIFFTVQDILRNRSSHAAAPRQPNDDYPLIGTAKCPNCSSNLRSGKSSGNGGTFHYYDCRSCRAPNSYRIEKDLMESAFVMADNHNSVRDN